jgi:hypothetical protein
MYYGSVTKGYKSGGFGSFAIFPDVPFGTIGVTRDEARPDKFDPEEVISYELGTKGRFLEAARSSSWSATTTPTRTCRSPWCPARHLRREHRRGGRLGRRVGQPLLNDYWDLFLSAAWADTEISDVQVACGSVTVRRLRRQLAAAAAGVLLLGGAAGPCSRRRDRRVDRPRRAVRPDEGRRRARERSRRQAGRLYRPERCGPGYRARRLGRDRLRRERHQRAVLRPHVPQRRHPAGAPLRAEPAAHLRRVAVGSGVPGGASSHAAGSRRSQRRDREHHFHPFTDFKPWASAAPA